MLISDKLGTRRNNQLLFSRMAYCNFNKWLMDSSWIWNKTGTVKTVFRVNHNFHVVIHSSSHPQPSVYTSTIDFPWVEFFKETGLLDLGTLVGRQKWEDEGLDGAAWWPSFSDVTALSSLTRATIIAPLSIDLISSWAPRVIIKVGRELTLPADFSQSVQDLRRLPPWSQSCCYNSAAS